VSETSQTVRSPAPAGRGLGGFLCRYEAGGANAQPHFAAASIAPWLKLDGLGTSFEYGHVPPPPLARDPDPLTQGSPLPDSESRFGIRRCQALVLKTACCNRKGLAPSPNEGTSRPESRAPLPMHVGSRAIISASIPRTRASIPGICASIPRIRASIPRIRASIMTTRASKTRMSASKMTPSHY
jgi:hypothetical protein